MTDYSEAEMGAITTVFMLARCTCVISTGSSHRSSGLKLKSMAYLLMMQKCC